MISLKRKIVVLKIFRVLKKIRIILKEGVGCELGLLEERKQILIDLLNSQLKIFF